ncbi:TlpA family protein disulfide reductase [Candidatus Thiodiazotropha sp. CDECU1]|uniref:TlpA family protein disulfide reductase n=1 Tax=Candidatus Thiodiazotropha sp. CDECU1 TaxID=3065865 RepID=UPI00292D4E2B|nr:TlpA disulfide reductase family protein [Candidatus Thiodiazotropha sp. CDECU1]
MIRLRALGFLFILMTGQVYAVEGQAAPEWRISEWLNGDGTTVEALRGKVVVVDFFQLWCPGCNSFSVPLMADWEKKYTDQVAAGNIVFLSIHTVFEGHDYQNPERLRDYVKKKGITHPVGIDLHLPGEEIPQTMRRYRTRGTPEMAIIDRNGIVRFQRFGGFDPEIGERLIDRLLRESTK